MVRPFVVVFLLATLSIACEESTLDPATYPSTLPDYCGTNTIVFSTTCACEYGHDWCVPDDPNDWNCCAASETPDGEIIVVYEGAEDEFHQMVEAYLMEQGLHEAVAELFTNLFAFPEDLYVTSGECGVENAFFTRTRDGVAFVGMCYELYRAVQDIFTSSQAQNSGISAEEAGASTFQTWSFVLFHELGHALIDIFDIPIVAAEEDAVDGLATALLVSMDLPVAAIRAATFWFLADDQETLPHELADEHSLHTQRFYNILCLVYGSDPSSYPSIADLPGMESRLARCENEWEAVNTNWGRLLEPHLR